MDLEGIKDIPEEPRNKTRDYFEGEGKTDESDDWVLIVRPSRFLQSDPGSIAKAG